jgi:hypothetical protein
VAGVFQHPASGRGPALGGPCAGRGQPPRARGMPAHGRRLRRQGNPVRPPGRVGRHCREQVQVPGQAAAGPRRRLHDHRQAPPVCLRLHRRLRRHRPDHRPAAHHAGQLRLQRRPLRPGGRPRGLPRRQRLFPQRRGHHLLPLQDEHPEPHRVSRLWRAAGRDRHRDPAGRHRAAPRARRAGCAPAQFVWDHGSKRDALPDAGRGQHPAAAAGAARTDLVLSRAAPADRGVERAKPSAQARPGDHTGEVRHQLHGHAVQPGRRAGACLHRRQRDGEPRRHRNGPGPAHQGGADRGRRARRALRARAGHGQRHRARAQRQRDGRLQRHRPQRPRRPVRRAQCARQPGRIRGRAGRLRRRRDPILPAGR